MLTANSIKSINCFELSFLKVILRDKMQKNVVNGTALSILSQSPSKNYEA